MLEIRKRGEFFAKRKTANTVEKKLAVLSIFVGKKAM
jgi:hypothetical protein